MSQGCTEPREDRRPRPRHLWHPFTQQRDWCREEPLVIERAEGTDLIDADGRRYIDGVSSLWCNVHGHRHPRIDRRRARAARPGRPLDDARPHAPAAPPSWPRGWSSSRPPGLTRVFYSDSGSTRDRDRAEDGVPVLAAARRPARTAHVVRLACATPTTATRSARSRSAASTSSTPPTRPLLFQTPPRRAGRRRRSSSACSTVHAEEIAAVIVEPLVQGAAGMQRPAARATCARVRELCDRARRAPDLRRGRDRLRPHRDDVRLRAGAASRPTSSASARG